MIEAVYYRHGCVCAATCETVESAVAYLWSGADAGELSDVGVFVDGEPVLTDAFPRSRPPTAAETDEMRSDYAKAHRHDELA